MNRIPTLVAAAAATGLLAAPASALAATSSVVAGPVKVKGYDLTLSATDNGASGDSFSIMATKKSGQSTQMHMWSFPTGVAVSIKGAKATIKGSLGSFGAIDAKVAAGGKRTGRIPAGCKGSAGSSRQGTLKGKNKLVLDTTFFKTVAPKSMKALIAQGGKLDCGSSGGGTPTSGVVLTSMIEADGGQVVFTIVKTGGTVTQQAMRSDTVGAASVMHLITAQTGASGLEAASDLSSATAPGVSPFFGGTLSFTGEPMGGMAAGTVSGGFAAKFDSIGTQTLPADNDAMLMQR